mgnify:CR=1 FL=1
MNKLILGAAIFSLSMLANATSADVTVTASSEQVYITADKSDVALSKSDCIKETGTRIKAGKDKKGCNGLAGRLRFRHISGWLLGFLLRRSWPEV